MPIPPGEASLEHLIASSNGGTNDDGNCVVCCKALNAAFGSKPYKDKLRAVLNHRGPFTCPRKGQASHAHPTGGEQPDLDEQVGLVVIDLQRRGSARPRKEKTLRNTIAALFQQKLAQEELSSLLARLQGGRYITIEEGKVVYNLPQSSA